MTSSGLSLPETFPGCKWVFPSSQTRYSTVFQDELDEWFDIYSLTDPSAREELQIGGLRDSIEFIHRIISEEAKLVTPERVVLLGLSQGSATGELVRPNASPSIGFSETFVTDLCVSRTRLTRSTRQRSQARRIRRAQWVAASGGSTGWMACSG